MKAVGIIGASGYSGEVLLEILAKHPKIEKLVVASRSHSGKRVDSVLARLAGVVGDLHFVNADAGTLSGQESVSIWFLALPHGVAAKYAVKLVEAGRIVIDLSADFRLNSAATYTEYYKAPHPAPEWLQKVPYVLPEFSDRVWRKANLIACPGCYPTSILLPLLPLLRDKIISGEGIIINAMSGISGAGKKEDHFYSYCERSESVVAYGLGKHRHLAEIEEQLGMIARKAMPVQFTPHLVPMMRGIATTIVIPEKVNQGKLYTCWNKTYGKSEGVRILESGTTPDTRNLLGRNRIDFSGYVDQRTGNTVITSAIDNLMKGAGGQAVQIMNLRLGWPEFLGLS